MELARGPEMVANLMARASRVQEAARKQVRIGHVRGGGQHARRQGARADPINLHDSIVKRVVEKNGLPAVEIGSNVPHAIFVHEGTRPHIIRPHDPDGVLAFYVGSGGNASGMAFAKFVNHPGTRPNKFLLDNLHLAAQ